MAKQLYSYATFFNNCVDRAFSSFTIENLGKVPEQRNIYNSGVTLTTLTNTRPTPITYSYAVGDGTSSSKSYDNTSTYSTTFYFSNGGTFSVSDYPRIEVEDAKNMLIEHLVNVGFPRPGTPEFDKVKVINAHDCCRLIEVINNWMCSKILVVIANMNSQYFFFNRDGVVVAEKDQTSIQTDYIYTVSDLDNVMHSLSAALELSKKQYRITVGVSGTSSSCSSSCSSSSSSSCSSSSSSSCCSSSSSSSSNFIAYFNLVGE